MKKAVVVLLISLLIGLGSIVLAADPLPPPPTAPATETAISDQELVLTIQLVQSQIQVRQYEIVILQQKLEGLTKEYKARQEAKASDPAKKEAQ